jgi:polyphosphate kinase 2 (PPK2 family)
MQPPSLSRLLKQGEFPRVKSPDRYRTLLEELQHKMLRVQQGLYHGNRRAIVAIEGFDAAGKGGAIRRLTEAIDPRGVKVIPIGPPAPEEQGRHWLYRFWRELPLPGTLTVFDRTWYGRVLVERVEKLASKWDWKRAYDEINEFEAMLVDDGIDVVKLFLAISKDEQLKRFQARVRDPYKQWKIGPPDIEARKRWDKYVDAADDLFELTDTKRVPWHLIPANYKWYARTEVLRVVTKQLARHGKWVEDRAVKLKARHIMQELKKLKD